MVLQDDADYELSTSRLEPSNLKAVFFQSSLLLELRVYFIFFSITDYGSIVTLIEKKIRFFLNWK